MPFTPILAALLLAGFAALASPAQAQGAPAGTAPTEAPKDEKPAASPRPRASREPSIGQIALRERQRKCGAEWKEMKAGGKVADGLKWPKFWSQCNARLKGSTA